MAGPDGPTRCRSKFDDIRVPKYHNVRDGHTDRYVRLNRLSFKIVLCMYKNMALDLNLANVN